MILSDLDSFFLDSYLVLLDLNLFLPNLRGGWYFMTKGGGHFDTFTGPMLFCGYRSHLLTYFDEMLYGSLY